jgi:hypothetical protein
MNTPRPGAAPAEGGAPVSPELRRIKERVAGLPEPRAMRYWLPTYSDEELRDWIAGNRELIEAAAADHALPPEMIAGIAWLEIVGAPLVVDDLTYGGRAVLPGTVDRDRTSMGPLAVQVRRAAEVLGYDPGSLDDAQRDEVVEAVKDPALNVFVAAGYLARMRAQSPYADVPPEGLSPDQLRDLATRYNGGPPHWRSDDAQEYGRRFAEHLPEAAAALRD